mgnify:CR=1 FL=1|tara:strand:- start:3263 stop:3895 length:633 start_codon:yes stop_codon:yes gene_type:complete
MNETNCEIDLETFFNEEIKNPFTYDVKLNIIDDSKKLFEEIKQIFIKGVMYKTKQENIKNVNQIKSLLITQISNNEIELVKKYMLSIGIEVVHKQYNAEDKDYHIRGLLYELERNFKDIKIEVTMDWMKQLIHKVHITLNPLIVDKFNTIIRKHPEANFFLNLYTPKNIEDYYISFNQNNILHIIYFKPANIHDYQYQHKYATQFTKHIR